MTPDPVQGLLERLPARPLESMLAATLLDRIDEKYLVPEALLPPLLAAAEGAYEVLTVRGARSQYYETTYFDTPTLAFFRAHHTGRAIRHKVRERHYVATDARVLEVKTRAAGGRTVKLRIPRSGSAVPGSIDADLPPDVRAATEAEPLGAVLCTRFDRVTLLREGDLERVTIDRAVRVADELRELRLDCLLLVEIKQASRAASPLRDAMRAAGLRPQSISKYCIGVALLRPDVPHNRFKPLLSSITRLGGQPVPHAG